MDNKFYCIVYGHITDPNEVEVQNLITQLEANNIKIHDQIPGTLLVKCREDNLKAVVDDYPEWSYSLTAQLN